MVTNDGRSFLFELYGVKFDGKFILLKWEDLNDCIVKIRSLSKIENSYY